MRRRPPAPPIELDISLNAPSQVLVQGRRLNLNLSLKAHVGGTSPRPGPDRRGDPWFAATTPSPASGSTSIPAGRSS